MAVLLAALLLAGIIAVVLQTQGEDAAGTASDRSSETQMDTIEARDIDGTDQSSEPPPTMSDDLGTTTSATAPDELASVPPGRWILILDSLPKDLNDLPMATASASRIAGGDPRVVVLSSDDTPGLNDGYWVIAVASFDTREQTVANCASFGRSIGGSCYPTRVGDGAR